VKHKFSLALVALITFSLALPIFVVAQQPSQGSIRTPGRTEPSTTGRRSGVRSSGTTILTIDQDFKEALGVIRQNYIEGNKLDYNTVYKSSMTGMLRTLDPHSSYFDREEFEELKSDQRSEYFGIGATIQNFTIGEKVETYITATFDHSPAWRGGLRYGDRIDAVDGVSMHGKPSAEVRDKIRGPRDSHVKVTVTRAGIGQVETVEIVRASVPQPSVPDYYFIRPGVGYVDMTRGFNYDTAEGLQDALDHLHQRGLNSLVLDLRGNPGGFLDSAIAVASTFLPQGQLILTQRGHNGQTDRVYKSNNPEPDRTPMVILVNETTASASEIVAGAMQDHDRALIVGQTSFGKGLVQSIINLPEGAGLTLTSAKYYTPANRLIQRDYSDGGWYNYISHGGTLREGDTNKPAGPASRTDTGRPVYGGGGITPDEAVKEGTFTTPPRYYDGVELRLRHPIFFFARELVNGRVNGFDQYKNDRAIVFDHDIQPNEFPVTGALFKAFSDFVAKDPNWKQLIPQLERKHRFIENELRFQLATAAYGSVAALQVTTKEDPQVARAVDLIPRARDLAAATRIRSTP
jgi:carboxyl-terminal processing protease